MTHFFDLVESLLKLPEDAFRRKFRLSSKNLQEILSNAELFLVSDLSSFERGSLL